MRTVSPPHFAAILAEAVKLGLPTRFRTDLTVHDRQCLARRDPRLPFAWIAYEHGTYLALPCATMRDRKGQACLLREILTDGGSFPGALGYWWDGRELRGASADQLAELIACPMPDPPEAVQ